MVSIFTPTFNRCCLIRNLANSLLMQTSKNFEWIVVDDGSTDDTEMTIKQYGDKIKIIYFKQPNAGKHIAYNKGIELSTGDLFVCVDSDDTLSPNAIETYEKCIDENAVGFLLPQKLTGIDDSSKWKKIDEKFIDVADLRFRYRIIESNPVIKMKYLNEYRFPQYTSKLGEKEKFCPEDLLYNFLAKDGKFLVVNKAVYNSEYQEDGLTKKVFDLWIRNTNGVLAMLNSRYEIFQSYGIWCKVLNRCKCILNLNALCMRTRKSIWNNTPSKCMSIVLYVPSIIFRYMRFS